MTEDILISIKGLHTTDGVQDEEIEVTSAGKYYLKNGKHYIIYEELDEETGSAVKNLIKLDAGCMELQKKGPMSGKMIFEYGKKNASWYGTPFGNMLAGIEVTDMEMREQEKLIEIDIDYILEVNYEHVADSRIQLRIMAKDSGLFHLVV